MIKNPPANAGNAGDMSLIPGFGRPLGEGNGNPLQNSCLEIPWTEEPGGLYSSRGCKRVSRSTSKGTLVSDLSFSLSFFFSFFFFYSVFSLWSHLPEHLFPWLLIRLPFYYTSQ